MFTSQTILLFKGGFRMKIKEHDYITLEEYKEIFKDENIKKEALKQALDIRKFEIELYWKRATYFWAFIAATFAGYFVIMGSTSELLKVNHTREVILFLLNSLGLLFSIGWYIMLHIN